MCHSDIDLHKMDLNSSQEASQEQGCHGNVLSGAKRESSHWSTLGFCGNVNRDLTPQTESLFHFHLF